MLEVLDKIGNKRPIHLITKSPNQYPDFEREVEIKPIESYEGTVVILMTC